MTSISNSEFFHFPRWIEKVQKVKLSPNTDYELSVSLKIKAGSTGKVIFDTEGVSDAKTWYELDANTKSDEWIELNSTFIGDCTMYVSDMSPKASCKRICTVATRKITCM